MTILFICLCRVSLRVTQHHQRSGQCNSAVRTFSSTPPGWSGMQTTSTTIYCSVKHHLFEMLPKLLPPPAPSSSSHQCSPPSCIIAASALTPSPLHTDQNGRPEHIYSRLDFSKVTVWEKKSQDFNPVLETQRLFGWRKTVIVRAGA